MAFAALLVLFSGGYTEANTINDYPSGDRSGWFVDMNRFAQSAHAALTCDDCHGTMMEGGRRHPDRTRPDFLKRSATRAYDYSRCGKCHQLAYERYQSGGHAEAMAAEQKAAGAGNGETRTAPTCGDCHVSHYDRSGLPRVDVGRRMIQTCGRCHPAHTHSYLDNNHGRLGVDLGDAKSAFCTDCHGAHTVNSLKNDHNALAACRRCHQKAEAEFANIVIHASLESAPTTETEKKRSLVWIERVRWISIAVVAISLAFFFGHSFLWLLREIHEKLRKH